MAFARNRTAGTPVVNLGVKFESPTRVKMASPDWQLEVGIWNFRSRQGWPVIHPKNLTKTLLSVCDPTRAVQLATKGGEIDLKQLLKAMMIVAVLATALSFGACAQRKETVTTSAGTTGYHK